MQIRETIDNPSTASTESLPEDVITLVDSPGVALRVQHAFSAKTRAVRPGGVSIASRWVKIPLVGPERQDHKRTREGLQPASARGRRLTDRRRLTRLWKRLPAQARPVITRANNSKLPTTTTALDQHQIKRLNASAMDKIVQAASGILSSIKRKQGSAACSVSRSNLSRD
jgi:hypothetical protein